MTFAPIEDLLREIRNGRMVIVVDSEDRENEGDLVMAAQKVTPESIRFMATVGRGLICAPLAPDIIQRLELPPMGDGTENPEDCAFTVSVDAVAGISTGISAADRANTSQLLADPDSKPSDFKRPGHLFPLRARAGGVLERSGHTEAAVDLARLAGLRPAGVICEVMNDDGTMARLSDLELLARQHGLLLGSIESLIAYRRLHDPVVATVPLVGLRHMSSAELPTPMGTFIIHVFRNARDEDVIALTLGAGLRPRSFTDPVLVRVHSACFTGDLLGSLRCDCGGQLNAAMECIGREGRGILVYLPQEGRGIGLAKKIEAYRLQQGGMDTVEANRALGFPPDLRRYDDAADALRWLGVAHVRLLSNNPDKIQGLQRLGIDVIERVPLEVGSGPANVSYLQAKKGKLGHLFEAV
ncbi:MAG: 3,4-dihydroxy-2-butanone-4-phosphate synthase [Planctomycetota bacterium]